MPHNLEIDYAVITEKGSKQENADAADAMIPTGEALQSKGIAAAIADGMSSSEGGKIAAEVCVSNFLSDYYSTPDSWAVKTCATKILGATNRWLFSQGQTRYESARGMVTTFSALVIKSTTAHIFHVGDSRIYHYRNGHLDQVTRDHRVWVSKDRDFLSRAMGIDPHLDIDYKSLGTEEGDVFLFVTDGVSGHITDNRLQNLLREHTNLKACAQEIIEEALRNGSTDNVTCQLLRIQRLPVQNEDDLLRSITDLPFPPNLVQGMKIDDYEILRELHASKRSEVFLARDLQTNTQVILKTPSVNYQDEPAFLDAFLHEEWVGKRISNPHVLKVLDTPGRRFLYNISEYVEGQSLRQWITDHPQTHINTARTYLQQITDGLRAFHRLEMIHLDLKPENILIDKNGTLKIIDFGSTKVAGIAEINTTYNQSMPQATVNYAPPECQDAVCSNRSDIFSLGVIAYELLTGKLPYGNHEKPIPQRKMRYISATRHNPDIQSWVDAAIKKAVHPNPKKRYATLSEFLFDLSHPNEQFKPSDNRPLIERHPLTFWKTLAGLSVLLNVILLFMWLGNN